MPIPRVGRFLPILALLACTSSPALPVRADAGTTHDRPVDASSTSDATPRDGSHPAVDAPSEAAAADAGSSTTLVFDLDADTTKPASFYSSPFPSDLRLNAAGAPDYSGAPLSSVSVPLGGIVTLASSRKGFPSVPVAYFQFTGPTASLDATKLIAPTKSSPILLIDVDPASPDKGTLLPTVASTPPSDAYTAANVVTVAPYPGFVLAPKRSYAIVIRRELGDAAKAPLGVDATLALLSKGKTPPGPHGAAAAKLFAPLWDTLKTVGVAADDVAAATVFTTGDVVADTAAMASQLVAKYPATLSNLSVPATGSYPRICEITGTISLPQFQQGTPPFTSSGGLFVLDANGQPTPQGVAEVPMAISLPTTGPMPAAGFPLVLYFHGSGGISTQFVDRGPILTPDGGATPGQGPAYVLAPFGFAMAGSALPANPERIPGASDTEYLQLGNLPAVLGTFLQGIVEQRLFLAALEQLSIPPSVVASACPGVTLPAGQTAFHFDASHVFAQGQSMGGMYANIISAVEPAFQGVVPSGAGGFWTYFIFQSSVVPDATASLSIALGISGAPAASLTFMHPGLSMLEAAWEAIDPIVSAPRISKNPLPGTSPRPIYEPVGQNDSYFSNAVYDAMSVAYGHKQVGSVVWSTMQDELGVASLGGIVPYPASQTVSSLDGTKYTGVVAQYEPDPITGDGHYIFQQLDSVKYQYGCFLSTILTTGVAVTPAPAALGTPCPTE